jgi:hypothetical protein
MFPWGARYEYPAKISALDGLGAAGALVVDWAFWAIKATVATPNMQTSVNNLL